MDISVIIVSYNTAAATVECLKSVEAANGAKEIFVVDNASTDESVQKIRQFSPDIHLIVNKRNRGFAAANNQVLPLCRGRYIIYLNPDTIVKPDTPEKAVTFMDGHQNIGLAGAKILNPDGSLQESVSWRYPGEKFTRGETAGLAGNIACVLGAFMIARKSLLDELHGFDEDFFLYGEDQDLAWRIREKGLSIGYIEEAEVLHWGGQSEVQTPPAEIFEKKLHAEYLFYTKHYTKNTIERIKRAQRLKAIFRLFTLHLSLRFSANKSKVQNKIDCYQLIYKKTNV
ncbi:MAG TPA: glycosyltransferase family 2 protein [Smithella sp.]|nr:glycosyltransferase family 2 protein [Smithella sp.]HOQ43436.1 glycosyltransferase family 2 protein [Smithellaceae bacterium]HOG91882.1 glycosyltransferase family 2 protein [Smithella sp.]HPN87631.1 glycosyltransferase family 2 protein [Smithella sp.]HPX31636.1 glycosyltransferase family 2 protein [Smithella sp.]